MEKFCINRFFFTITPPQPVQAFVSDIRNHVRKALGHGFEDEFSPVHMALFKYSDKTESLANSDLLISALLPFEIHIKGLSLFKHGANKTIYLQTEYKTPIPDLAKFFGGETVTPHIIVARNLNPDDFTKAWESLQSMGSHFFRCNTITLLKKEPNRWNQYLELPLDKNPFYDSNASVCVLTDRND
jgi:2'-5' RNA ligase